MKRHVLDLSSAPRAAGPYSAAVRFGDLIFMSGQGPLDPTTGEVVKGDVIAQARQVLRNIAAMLEEAGSSIDHVLKVVVYLTDMDKFAAVNSVYREVFQKDYPARTCVEVSRLPLGIDIEIDVIAAVKDETGVGTGDRR